MAQLPGVLNAKENEKMTDFSPVPAGWYTAEVVKSEMKNTAAGTGKYLNLQFKILEPEMIGEVKTAGRVFYVLMNLVNPNPIAVEIANKELASICDACDIDELEDSTELHGIEIGVRLSIKAGDANWPPKNEAKQYKASSEVVLEEEGDSPFGDDE